MSRPATAHARQRRAIALVAARASFEANVTAFEIVSRITADGADVAILASQAKARRTLVAVDGRVAARA